MQPDNLISLKDDMVAFVSGHGMRLFNGFITDDIPSVLFEEDDNLDGWKDFVELAKTANAPFLTMSELVLEKADVKMPWNPTNWQQILQVAQKVKAANPGVWPLWVA